MIKEIMNQATIYSVKKIVKNAMNNHLNIQPTQHEIHHRIDPNKSYLLYLHVPFCHTFCPFCSFHKFKYEPQKAKKYFQTLRKEMKKVSKLGIKFDSLYVGGGTTLINEEELIKTLDLAKELFDIQEISCESDPNHIDPKQLEKFVGSIDRLSIGVQSFDDNTLKQISRYEKFGSGKILAQKIQNAQGILPSTNLDLIFNFPNQTKQMLEYDLQMAQALGVEQITTYPLMRSELTDASIQRAFSNKVFDQEFMLYQHINKQLGTYHQNNAWSFAKQKSNLSDEYLAKHSEYIGLGSGAFSFVNGTLYINAFDLNQYENLVEKQTHPIIASSKFAKKQILQHNFLNWLFNGSIDIPSFDAVFQTSLKKELSQEIFMLKKAGAIVFEENKILPTTFGKYLSLVMMKEFYSGMDKVRAMFRQNELAMVV